MNNRFNLLQIAALLPVLMTPFLTQAQSVSLGADFFNRYVWRGYDFGDSFSIQPDLSVSAGGFTLGTWGSYSISADGASANEHDIYASYSIALPGSGSVDFAVTDYYFPNTPGEAGEWSNFDDEEGAHFIELMGSVTLPESFPLTLAAAFMVHNDPDDSIYLEASVPFSVSDVDLGFTLGVVAGESGFYGTEDFALVNLGISASKDLQITESFALPLTAGYILNTDTNKSYLVFGFSLSP
ncbi:MAG: hypothetical protein OXE59_04565 [Bacteroidetes bacterium]|nr:hypothetical protein [Bacteroidota bacterium]MCY4233001.1 hypothetical protein [Bacteroidota bacterium]